MTVAGKGDQCCVLDVGSGVRRAGSRLSSVHIAAAARQVTALQIATTTTGDRAKSWSPIVGASRSPIHDRPTAAMYRPSSPAASGPP